jgi:uncharacterized Zn finger protein (UPF0148 family)
MIHFKPNYYARTFCGIPKVQRFQQWFDGVTCPVCLERIELVKAQAVINHVKVQRWQEEYAAEANWPTRD